MRTEARLLGPVELLVNDTDVTPTSIRARTFLVSLLLRSGQPVPVETLTEELWGDSPPATARAQVHTYASRLRRDFSRAGETGQGLLATHPIGYTLLIDPQHVDLFRFTALLDDARTQLTEARYERAHDLLTTAVKMWRGPALAGVTANSRLAVPARRLEAERLEALSLRIEADLRLGRPGRVIPELRALADEHPHHEPFRTQLAQALHEASRTTEALDVLRALAPAAKGRPTPAPQTPPEPPSPAPAPPAPQPPAPLPPAIALRGPGHSEQLRFSVLGPVRVRRGEEPVNTGSPQQRALLAALLLRGGRTATAPELIDALWGEEPPHAAVAALRTYASRLRKALGPDVVVSTSGGYAIRVEAGALDVDVATELAPEAERARHAGDITRARDLLNQALALWDGEPLAGLPGPYADNQRIRLEEWRLSLLETRLDLDLELGLHAEAVSELTALTAAHPLRERLRELLMLALYRSGRQAEALAVYADTRRLLAEELGVDPSADLSDLQQRILQADSALAAPAEHSPAPGPPVPAQLPATVPDFTGRAAFVHELSEQLATADGRIMAISAVAGIGGVGKTTLAVHLAHAVRQQFPDGQLYVDLQGGSPTPAAPETVLASFLRALGTPDPDIPDGIEDRAALYRSLLGSRRVLVLLDNAHDAAQVRPLLPGTEGCAAIITSRVRMVDLAFAHLVDLDVMSPEEALALFTRIVGEERVRAEREAALDVVAACGFLPLAIRIAASRLAARRTWTVSVLAAKLADERRRLDELRAGDLAVTATFQLGYGQLQPYQARAFRLLGLADGSDISLPAAAALLDMDVHNTEDALESLVDTSLLDSAAPGRYRYHHLVRLFARACAERDEQPPEDREAALSRLLDFYLATAARAYAQERPGDRLVDHLTPTDHPGLDFLDRTAALDWLYGEADCLLACVAQTAAAPASDTALRRAADLLLTTSDLAESGAHTRQYEAVAVALGEAAVAAGDLQAEGRVRTALSRALSLRGDYEQADEQARHAMAAGLAAKDLGIAGHLLNQRGTTALSLGLVREAEAHLSQAIEAFQAADDRPGEAGTLVNLSRVHLTLGRMASAVELARQGVALYESLGLTSRLAGGKYALGVALTAAGHDPEAVGQLTHALGHFRDSRQRLWEGTTHYRLAEAHLAMRRPAQAAAHAEQALTTGVIGGEWRRATVLTVLGRALTELGHADRAHACWREALAIHERLGAAEAEDVRALLGELAPAAATTAAASSPPRPR